MTRPKFTHKLASHKEFTPEWLIDHDTQLVVERQDGLKERWNIYLERDEKGSLRPALPPSARKKQNKIQQEKRNK
jgi:hypothetical protein